MADTSESSDKSGSPSYGQEPLNSDYLRSFIHSEVGKKYAEISSENTVPGYKQNKLLGPVLGIFALAGVVAGDLFWNEWIPSALRDYMGLSDKPITDTDTYYFSETKAFGQEEYNPLILPFAAKPDSKLEVKIYVRHEELLNIDLNCDESKQSCESYREANSPEHAKQIRIYLNNIPMVINLKEFAPMLPMAYTDSDGRDNQINFQQFNLRDKISVDLGGGVTETQSASKAGEVREVNVLRVEGTYPENVRASLFVIVRIAHD